MIAVLLLLVVVVVVAAIVLATRRTSAPGSPSGGARSVSRFFQYLLLFGLVVVVAIGVAGLVSRALGEPTFGGDLRLARNLSFVVVGVPLLAALTWWSWRQLAADPVERTSVALAVTVVLAGTTSLAVVMVAAHAVVDDLLLGRDVGHGSVGNLVAWGPVLVAAWWAHAVAAPRARRLYHVVGSLLGLATTAVGTGTVLGRLGTRALFGPDPDVYAADWRSGLATLVVGLPVWVLFWWRHAARAERDTPWLVYVVLVGVGGGFVAALVSLVVAVATSAIWLVGRPGIDVADLYFHDAPSQVAGLLVGLAVWWYHRGVLGQAGTSARTPVQRVYEYLMAGIALVAAACGLMVLVAAGIEAVTTPEPDAGDAVANTLVVAATVLVVSLPVWGAFWRRVQAARRADPVGECRSTVRRTYLALLVGVAAVAAVIAAITGAYRLFEDAVTATVGSSTLHGMRYPIGIVLAAGAVAIGNAVQLRHDRALLPSTRAGGRRVVLVGPADPHLVRAVADATGAHVQAWWTDGDVPWPVDDVTAALASAPGDAVVLCESGELHVVPVRRA